MTTFLVERPAWLLVTLALALFAGSAVVARAAMVRAITGAAREQAATVAGPLMPALGAAFGVLVAFTIGSEWVVLRAAQDDVAAEAAAASRLAWASTSPGVETGAVVDALVVYLGVSADTEFSGDATQTGSAEAFAELGELERTVRAQVSRPGVPAAASSELLASLDALTTARRDRFAAAGRRFLGLVLALLVVSGLALVADSVALTLRFGRRVALLVAGLVAVVAMSIATILAISAPFRGSFSVRPEPIRQVIAGLDAGLIAGPRA
ncbi:MAG: hypothetical protein IPM45_05540 [Acidimicrobiales bacterium]|nr:hypothetical protein [Acidimicrobiales bacterium]